MKKSEEQLAIFEKYIPETAVSYCYDLLLRYGFQFRITRSRKTKLGDYRFDNMHKKHCISVNHDLNPFQFLITYIHEVAHLVTFEEFQHRVKPHGVEWKNNFKELMKPLINSEIFPKVLLGSLNFYLANPKASSCSDPALFRALGRFDITSDGEQLLSDIRIGGVFKFRNRFFQKELKKRTRSVCMELATGRKFLIPEVATVEPRSSDHP